MVLLFSFTVSFLLTIYFNGFGLSYIRFPFEPKVDSPLVSLATLKVLLKVQTVKP